MKKTFGTLVLVLLVGMLSHCKKDLTSMTTDTDLVIPVSTGIGTEDGTAVTKEIGSSGGSILSSDGNLELIIPSGALDANTTISIQPITNELPDGNGKAYRCLPEGLHFASNITLKFHYTKYDLAATHADYMGIAYQKPDYTWQPLEDFINDTLGLVLSGPVNHFTDFVHFDVLRIGPAKSSIKPGQSLGLQVFGNYQETGPDDLPSLPLSTPLNASHIIWKVNGIENGDDINGRISSVAGMNAVYIAPASIQGKKTVTVSAEINGSFKMFVMGKQKTFNKAIVVAIVQIAKTQKYTAELGLEFTFPNALNMEPEKYYDHAIMTLTIDENNIATIADIQNFTPIMDPPSVTTYDNEDIYHPGEFGVLNITDISNEIRGDSIYVSFLSQGGELWGLTGITFDHPGQRSVEDPIFPIPDFSTPGLIIDPSSILLFEDNTISLGFGGTAIYSLELTPIE